MTPALAFAAWFAMSIIAALTLGYVIGRADEARRAAERRVGGSGRDAAGFHSQRTYSVEGAE